jgi:predicted nucleic acid-binding protein
MKPTSVSPTIFVDTQALIYAFEKREADWLQFIDTRISSGYRLVVSEELLYEFGQSSTIDIAMNLAMQVVERDPLWIRNFADLEADEVCRFARTASTGSLPDTVSVFSENFGDISQFSENRQLDPQEFVRCAFDPRTRDELLGLAREHAEVLDALSQAVSDGLVTKDLREQALRSKLRALLSRGSALTKPILGYDLEVAVKFCFKHHKFLIRQCPAYATEWHLADYRTLSPKRIARVSDSKDLMLATAAFPYVTSFVTNDGYLHGALSYVKKRLPHITTELIRGPAHAA